MKKDGILKKVLAILIIVLLCLVSFGGIYKKDKNIMKNIIPDYELGMDLDSSTILKLAVEKTDEESETTESQGENENKDGQADNNNTLENYKKTKNIIEKRLKLSGVEQYTLRLDEQTGDIVLEFSEKVGNSIIAYAITNGDVKLNVTKNVNNEENTSDDNSQASNESAIEEIANNKSIKNVTVTTKNLEYAKLGGAYVEMKIEFTNDAVKKFKELKDNYAVPVDSDGKETDNTVTLSMDDTTIYSRTESVFLASAVNGSIVIESNYATDAEHLAQIEKTFNSAKAVLETEKLPVKYTGDYYNTVHSNINNIGIISVFAVILAIMLVYLIIKYRLNGLFAEFIIFGFTALLLLVLRLTNVQISVSSIVSIIGMIILQFIYLINILNKDSLSVKWFNRKTIEFTKMLIPAFILGIVTAILPALKDIGIIPGNIYDFASFGMVVFWGLIVFEIYNNIISRAILTNAKNK